MLALSQFFPGILADAPLGSMILPRDKYERCGIVASHKDEPFFVILGDEHRFRGFPSKDNTSHKGLIIPAVSFEIDETSLVPMDPWDTPLGCIVCTESVVGIRAEMIGARSQGIVVAMLGAIPSSSIEAAFTRWQISLGTGQDKRVLMKIDAAARPQP